MKRNKSDILIAWKQKKLCFFVLFASKWTSKECETKQNEVKQTKENENDTKCRTKRKEKLNEAERRDSPKYSIKSRFCKEFSPWRNISRLHYHPTYFTVDSWTNLYWRHNLYSLFSIISLTLSTLTLHKVGQKRFRRRKTRQPKGSVCTIKVYTL